MKKALALTFMVILTLVLLAAAFVGVLMATLDPNDYKKDISEAVYKATGKQLQLRGNLEVSFFPWLALKTGKVIIGDPPAFGQEPFLEAEDASLDLAILPLLSREVEIKKISLQGARLKLVETATGQRNWEMGQSAGKKYGPDAEDEVVPLESAEKKAAAGQEDGGISLRIDAAVLSNITIVYRNLPQGLSYRLEVGSLELSDIRKDADMLLSLSGIGENLNNGLKAEFKLEAMFRAESNGSARGKISRFETVAKRDAATLSTSLAGEFYYDRPGETFVLDDIRAEANEMSVSGNMTFSVPTPKAPGLGARGEINISAADLDGLLAALAAMDKGKNRESPLLNPPVERIPGQQRPSADFAREDLPPGLRHLNADIKITADTLTIAKFKFSGLSTRIHAENGKISAPFDLALMGGPVTGGLEADLNAAIPSFKIKGKARDISMRDMTVALSGKDYISGPLSSDFDLKAQGLAVEEIKGSLEGRLEAGIAGGEAKGFKLIHDWPAGVPDVPVDFPIRGVHTVIRINKGLAYFMDLRMDSPMLSISGGGTANLNTGWAELRFDVSLPTPGTPAIPLKAVGPFESLAFELDLHRFMNKAEAAGEKALKKIPGQTEKVIKGIDGLLKKR